MKVLKIDTKGNIEVLGLKEGEGFISGASRLLETTDLDVRMITPPRGLINRNLELYSIDRAYDLNLDDNLMATVIYGTGHIIKGEIILTDVTSGEDGYYSCSIRKDTVDRIKWYKSELEKELAKKGETVSTYKFD